MAEASATKEIETPAPASNVQPQPQRQEIRIDDSKAIPLYSNFCRVMGAPEELVIDFAMNPQPMGVPAEPIAITQRMVTNYYTAKRLLFALQMAIQRHEQIFGVLEVDVQKRINPAAMQRG